MASTSGLVLACSLFDSLMFALIVYGIGVVLVLACCSFDLVRSVDLFMLVINGIGASGCSHVLHLMLLVCVGPVCRWWHRRCVLTCCSVDLLAFHGVGLFMHVVDDTGVGTGVGVSFV